MRVCCDTAAVWQGINTACISTPLKFTHRLCYFVHCFFTNFAIMQLSKVILAALAACVADAITIREVSNGIQLVNNNGGCLCNAANNGVKWGNGCGSNVCLRHDN